MYAETQIPRDFTLRHIQTVDKDNEQTVTTGFYANQTCHTVSYVGFRLHIYQNSFV